MDSLEDPGESRLEITTEDLVNSEGDEDNMVPSSGEDNLMTQDDMPPVGVHQDSIHVILFQGQEENGETQDMSSTLEPSVDQDEAADPQMSLVSFHGDSEDGNDIQAVDDDTMLDVEIENHSIEAVKTENTVVSSDMLSTGHQISHIQAVSLCDSHSVQTITLADGTTALVQSHPREGQTIQLEDGTTAILQNLQNKDGSLGPKLLEGQTIQLEDGTTAFVQAQSSHGPEGLQAVQLEDGSTAYIAPGLFGEGSELTGLSLEQLTGQAQLLSEQPKPGMELVNSTSSIASTGHASITASHSTQATITIMPDSKNQVHMSSERALALGDKAFRCNFDGCGRLYTTQHHLKVHERSHTGDKPFRCDFMGCGKAFATGYGLKSHTRVHTGEKPYKCPDETCDKSFKTSGDLQKHVRTHTGEKPFKCPFEGCERSFTTSNIRKVHIRTHTGERPYVCPEDSCNKAFASATNYKNHIRIHSGEKPYVCTVQNCGKRFTEYSSLYKHHVVHTHSKPYVCNHCGKNYRQTSTLAMHKRTAHGEDTTDSEAQLVSNGSQLAPMSGDNTRSQLQFHLTENNKASEGEGTLVINTAPGSSQVAVSSSGLMVAEDDSGLVPAPATVLHHLSAGLSLSADLSNLGQQQIYVVTDPSQLEALQAIAQQQIAQQEAAEAESSGGQPKSGPLEVEDAAEVMDTSSEVL